MGQLRTSSAMEVSVATGTVSKVLEETPTVH